MTMMESKVLMNSSRKWKPYANSFNTISMIKNVSMRKFMLWNMAFSTSLSLIYDSRASSAKMTTQSKIVMPRIDLSIARISTNLLTLFLRVFMREGSAPPSWMN